MKLIVKSDRDHVDIEATLDTAKKPIKIHLTKVEVESLLTILETAAKADKFSFTWKA